MPSLQLLQLTEHGKSFLASRRKTLLVASGIIVAWGTAAAYMKSRNSSRRPEYFSHHNGIKDNKEQPDKVVDKNSIVKKSRQKKGGLRSLKVLAAILLSHMGRMGARDFLSLVAIVVLRTAVSNRLAKVQGFLFRAAFLRRVPSFFRLIFENILLCFLQSTLLSTSKYVTGTLSLQFRKILTKLIHAQYFQNMVYYKISHVDGRINNPEQRIASDVPKFCSELSDLVQEDLSAVTDGLLYTWRLCSYASPKYVFWILAYVLGAGTMIMNFSPAFGKLMSEEQKLEGEYRQLHSRLRTHSESKAFYGDETREESHIQQKFKALVRHMGTVLHDHWWFGMIQDFLLKYLGATVAVILIIEPFFAGHLRPDTSILGRAEMLSNLRYHTSVIISLFQSLGTLSISSRRLNRLSGNYERDWLGSGSFYDNMDSRGECGVLVETMFYVPAENRAKFWYSTDYGMLRFCIADTEHDWREGTGQYNFTEHCLASVDRQKQPWLIFLAHRVLGYSSSSSYADEGSFA